MKHTISEWMLEEKNKLMAKSDYIYTIENYRGHGIIVIEDLNKGRMSVTNDIEYVLLEIGEKENIRLKDFIVVYKDSEGNWDGYDYLKEDFIFLHADNWKDGVDNYIAYKQKL